MKVLFVISSLGTGGAERVVTTLANHWQKAGRDITITTFDDSPEFYKLEAGITRVALFPGGQQGQGVVSAVQRMMRLRQVFQSQKPDVVISFLAETNVLTILAAGRLRKKVIVCERIDYRAHKIARHWHLLRRVTYPFVRITAQTRENADRFPRSWRDNVAIIPNPVRKPAKVNPGGESAAKMLVAMGRLVPQKGFDLLLKAFAALPRAEGWRLVIMGEGPDRDKLNALATTLGVAERVTLLPNQTSPENVLAGASIYVMSSRFEGFPNALVEGMAIGLPVVSFACPNGPAEIIRPGVDGLLVPPEDVSGLATAIQSLIDNPKKAEELGRRAAEVSDRFSLDAVSCMWDDEIERVTKG